LKLHDRLAELDEVIVDELVPLKSVDR